MRNGQRHDRAAQHDPCAPLAESSFGRRSPAQDRRQIGAGGMHRRSATLCLPQHQLLGHVIDQQSALSRSGKLLPVFTREQHRRPARLRTRSALATRRPSPPPIPPDDCPGAARRCSGRSACDPRRGRSGYVGSTRSASWPSTKPGAVAGWCRSSFPPSRPAQPARLGGDQQSSVQPRLVELDVDDIETAPGTAMSSSVSEALVATQSRWRAIAVEVRPRRAAHERLLEQ